VQATESQWAHADTLDTVGPLELQPGRRRRSAGCGTGGEQDPDPPPEPSDGERQRRLARRVEPLDVVDGDEHRPVRRQPFDNRQEGRTEYPLVGGGAVAGLRQQSFHRHGLNLGQFGDDIPLDFAEQVRQDCEGQHHLS
jgi:hypothetical protein